MANYPSAHSHIKPSAAILQSGTMEALISADTEPQIMILLSQNIFVGRVVIERSEKRDLVEGSEVSVHGVVGWSRRT